MQIFVSKVIQILVLLKKKKKLPLLAAAPHLESRHIHYSALLSLNLYRWSLHYLIMLPGTFVMMMAIHFRFSVRII